MSKYVPRQRPTMRPSRPGEKSVFDKAMAKVEFKKAVEEETLKKRAVDKLLSLGPDYYVHFFIAGGLKDFRKEIRELQVTKESFEKWMYVKTEEGESVCIYPNGKFHEDFEGYTFGVLIKAARQLPDAIKYTNDEGKSASVAAGNCVPDPVTNMWIATEAKTPPKTVPITNKEAAMCQIFEASLNVGTGQELVKLVKNTASVPRPQLERKNMIVNYQLPLEIKNIFYALLYDTSPEEDLTPERLNNLKWIWDHVGYIHNKQVLPCPGFTARFAYFSLFREEYPYEPGSINLADVLAWPYDYIQKDCIQQLLKNCAFVGGERLSPYHFLNLGCRFMRKKLIGGDMPVKWCNYVTVEGMTFERAGAFSGSQKVPAKIAAVRTVEEFTGFWYNPQHDTVKSLKKAAGLIVPYDGKGDGIYFILAFLEMRGYPRGRVWATYGPKPVLWVEVFKDGIPLNKFLLDQLWRTLPVMALYNFAASVNACFVKSKALELGSTYEVERAALEEAKVPFSMVWGVTFQDEKLVQNRPGLPVQGFSDYVYNDGIKDHKLVLPDVHIYYLPEDFLPGVNRIQKARFEGDATRAKQNFRDYAHVFADAAVKEDSADYGGSSSESEEDVPKPKRGRRKEPDSDDDSYSESSMASDN